MALGRIREALADCHRAAAVDPGFSKVRLRAANCHLMLGEFATASALYAECKEAGGVDAKVLAEVSFWICLCFIWWWVLRLSSLGRKLWLRSRGLQVQVGCVPSAKKRGVTLVEVNFWILFFLVFGGGL
jgi:hypothetical protein